MREKWRNLWQKLKNPSKTALVLLYVATFLCVVGAVGILFLDYVGTVWEIFAYVLFASAALTLTYTVYTVVIFVPKIKEKIQKVMGRYAFIERLRENYGFRTIIFSLGSFTVSVAYGAFNGALCVLSHSVWYGALAGYYILLAFLRGGILLYHRKKRKNGVENEALTEAKKYKSSGILLLVLHTALSGAIAQMIFSDQGFHYHSWSIYASAAYACFKITMAIVNLFKARKQDDLTIQAIRNANFVDAMVSVLALQTALLFTFGTEEINVSLFNTLTGIAVSACTLILSVGMIVKGSKRAKEIKSENIHGEQGV